MNILLIFVASFAGAVLSAMGMGGGGILLVYLTAYAGMPQLQAQGINLLFFLPVAGTAILLHHKKGLIRWRVAGRIILFSLPGVALGFWAARSADPELLSNLFGLLILVIGIRELAASFRSEK